MSKKKKIVRDIGEAKDESRELQTVNVEITTTELEQILGRPVDGEDIAAAKRVLQTYNSGGTVTSCANDDGGRTVFQLMSDTTKVEKLVSALMVQRKFRIQGTANFLVGKILDSISAEDIEKATFNQKINAARTLHEMGRQHDAAADDAMLKLTINIRDPETRKTQESVVLEYIRGMLNRSGSVQEKQRAFDAEKEKDAALGEPPIDVEATDIK